MKGVTNGESLISLDDRSYQLLGALIRQRGRIAKITGKYKHLAEVWLGSSKEGLSCYGSSTGDA